MIQSIIKGGAFDMSFVVWCTFICLMCKSSWNQSIWWHSKSKAAQATTLVKGCNFSALPLPSANCASPMPSLPPLPPCRIGRNRFFRYSNTYSHISYRFQALPSANCASPSPSANCAPQRYGNENSTKMVIVRNHIFSSPSLLTNGTKIIWVRSVQTALGAIHPAWLINVTFSHFHL